jgi:hypothetical protein
LPKDFLVKGGFLCERRFAAANDNDRCQDLHPGGGRS